MKSGGGGRGGGGGGGGGGRGGGSGKTVLMSPSGRARAVIDRAAGAPAHPINNFLASHSVTALFTETMHRGKTGA